MRISATATKQFRCFDTCTLDISMRVCVPIAVPVNSVNAHDEGLYVRVGGAAELAAGLSAEWGAVA